MKKKISEVDDINMQNLSKEMLQKDSGTFEFSKGNENLLYFTIKFLLSGWSVASVLSENELFAPAQRLMITLLVVTLLAAVILGIIIMLIAKRMASPLSGIICILRTNCFRKS